MYKITIGQQIFWKIYNLIKEYTNILIKDNTILLKNKAL